MNSQLKQRGWIVAIIIVSGLLWFYANELSGSFGYLMWFAPTAVILCSLNTTGKTAFLTAFLAYFIGKLSWYSYLVSVITIIPTIIFMFLVSLIFGLVLIATRRVIIKTNTWYSVFAFPVFFTAFEFLLLKFSPDGTAGSIAYSQSNFLPIIQIASLTGILGITFLITLLPAAIATGWYFRNEKNKMWVVLSTTGFIFALAFLFGIIRLSSNTDKPTIKVGLAVLDEKFHNITNHPEFQKEKLTTEYYSKQIVNLAKEGAKIVELPERAVNINKETQKEILTTFSEVAKQNRVYIITGYTNFTTDTPRNSGLVIDTNGNVVLQYDKVHLIKGLEDQFTIGNKIGLFNFNELEAGTAICKDLDFPDYIKKYKNILFLAIPAWDFGTNGWLHSRMAILRGVENGFSEIRTARQGRLTISDCYGRIINEADCSNGKGVSLLGNLSLQKSNTLYSRLGDWFGIINLIGAALFLFSTIRTQNKKLARQ
jgi:apolipoprotein N-acyltransferase